MTIGSGWAEGSWTDAGWVVGAWVQVSATKTIGASSQLEAFAASGTLQVVSASPAEPGTGLPTGNEAGALGGWQRGDRARRKKERILADDEEFMLMAQSALAEMFKNL